MAEERLIDRDKDNKYRIRVNENGEEELFVDDGVTEEQETEEVSFEVPEQLEEDDEDAAVMTPEQLAERRKQQEKERLERERKFASLLETAEKDIARNNFSTALEAAVSAEKLEPENGKVHALKLRIYTKNFTDYSIVEQAAEAAEDVKEYTSDEDKAQMLEKAEGAIKANISTLKASISKLDKENEERKAERAVKFIADKKQATKSFLCAAVPFAVFLVLAVVFSTMMFANESGVFLVLTIVFGCLALVTLVAVAFLARRLNITSHRVRLNKKNNSTQLGRDLIQQRARLKAFNTIYSALSAEDKKAQ